MAFHPRHLGPVQQTEAQQMLAELQVDPEGAWRMAGKMVARRVRVDALPCGAANILKQEMLAVGGDAAVARGTVACSIPTTSVVLIGTHKQLSILCERLPGQPFGLSDFAHELTALLNRLEQPPTRLYGRGDVCLDLTAPCIMGVLNVTPDSFSDGGKFAVLDTAIRHAEHLVEEGADLIDIGGESTRPGAPSVSVQQEMDRVLPVIERLCSQSSVPVSIDTTKSAVAEAAVAAGASFVNDISGLQFDPVIAKVAADTGAGLLLMHTRGRPETMQQNTRYEDLIGEVINGLRHATDAALAAGVPADRLAIDPGIGFGKDVAGNLLIMRRLEEFHCLGYPVLLGTSRKSFIGKVLEQEDPAERLNGTLATIALGVTQGVQIFRVHDVRAAKEVARMTHAMISAHAQADEVHP